MGGFNSLAHPYQISIFNSLAIAPVAQLDRAPDYGSGGWEFDSLRVCHFFIDNFVGNVLLLELL